MPSSPELTRLRPQRTPAERGFEKAILRLVRSRPERRAIAAGEIDAVVDPANGKAILLPEAQRALLDRRSQHHSLIGQPCEWDWEQDDQHRFLAPTNARFGDQGIAGKALWELALEPVGEIDWSTHRQQREWRADFRELEVACTDRIGTVTYYSLGGVPVFDEFDQFRGYRGTTRDITERKRAELATRLPDRYARLALDALALAVGVLDAHGQLLYSNRAWRSNPATLQSRGIAHGALSEDRSAERAAAIAIVEGGAVRYYGTDGAALDDQLRRQTITSSRSRQ